MNGPRQPSMQFVQTRAGDRCEYCKMHQSLQGATFHVEHVIQKSRGGLPDVGNFAWCCPSCNLRKSDRTSATDLTTGQIVPLYNPRADNWNEHFSVIGYTLIGRSPSARTTIEALKLNDDRRIRIRRAEERFGLFPPP
jgi:hypothetical protein